MNLTLLPKVHPRVVCLRRSVGEELGKHNDIYMLRTPPRNRTAAHEVLDYSNFFSRWPIADRVLSEVREKNQSMIS